MRLLILTQKVDKTDPILGFFHYWLEEFATRCSGVIVVCLELGEHTLPSNVKVYTLGKNNLSKTSDGAIKNIISKFVYAYRFYFYIWKERKNYDSVFVHMNEEYVLLAGFWWRLMGKRVALWRNHIKGSLLTSTAVMLSSVVFCTSSHSYTARFKKTKIVPAGTNLKKFKIKEKPNRPRRSILSIGRIDPIKNIDAFVDALNLLNKKGVDFHASIVGDPSYGNEEYYNKIKNSASLLVDSNKLVFQPSVPNTKTPEVYYSNEIFVNMTNSGSLDKTILSAMSTGALVVLCNLSFSGIVKEEFIFKENDPQDLAKKIESALLLNEDDKSVIRAELQKYAESQSLEKTIEMITQEIKN